MTGGIRDMSLFYGMRFLGSRPSRTFIRTFALAFSLALASCVVDDPRGSGSQLLSARWVQRDSLLVFSTLSQEWKGLPGEARYDESVFRIFQIHAGAEGSSGLQRVYEARDIVPCADLRYKDSLLTFSYLILSDSTGDKGGSLCGPSGHADSALAGQLRNARWITPKKPPSQASMTALLQEYPSTHALYSRDSGITESGTGTTRVFCVNGHCFGPEESGTGTPP